MLREEAWICLVWKHTFVSMRNIIVLLRKKKSATMRSPNLLPREEPLCLSEKKNIYIIICFHDRHIFASSGGTDLLL